MQRKFVTNLLLLLLLNLMVKPISLFWIDAGVQNRVGADEYGLYYTLLNISVLFNILLDLGVNNFTTKHIAQFPHLAQRYMGKMLVFRVLAYGVYLSVTLLVFLTLQLDDHAFYLLTFLLFNQFFIGLIAFARSHFAGLLLFRWDAFFSVADRLLLILSCGFLFLNLDYFQLEWFVYCLTSAYIITVILAYTVLFGKLGVPKFSFDGVVILSIIKQSLPYALLILFMMLYSKIDAVMLALLQENTFEVGIYAQGFRLLDAFYMFAMLFAGLLLPIFSRMIKQRAESSSLLLLACRLLLGGAILIAYLSNLYPQQVLGWIYTQDIIASVPSFQWLMLSFVPIALTLLFSTLLTALGELKKLNQVAGTSIVINILLNLAMIPTKGAEGAAIATFITQTLVALSYVWLCRAYFIPVYFQTFLLHLCLFAACLVAFHIFLSPFLEGMGLALCGGLAALLCSHFWQPRHWSTLIQHVQSDTDKKGEPSSSNH